MEQTPNETAGTQTPGPAGPDEETSLAENEHAEGPGGPEAAGPGETVRPKPPRRRARKVLRVEQEMGTLEMSDAVIATIVREECRSEDVAELRGRGLAKRLRKMFARGRIVDGVYVEQRGGCLSLEVTIAVRYGINIPALAGKIRARLAERIEHVTGCTVEAVNIVVDRIIMQ